MKEERAIHELSLAKSILEAVISSANAEGAKRITSVQLRVGILRDFVTNYFQDYFNHISRGTIAEGAIIEVEMVPLTICCKKCESVFAIDQAHMADYECPGCGCQEGILYSGTEMFIEGIDVI